MLLEVAGSLVRQLASASPSASTLAKRSFDTCSCVLPLSIFHCSWAESRSTGIAGSSNTPGNSSPPCAIASVALPPAWVASKSSVAPLRPGEPGCTRGGTAAAAVVLAEGVGAGDLAAGVAGAAAGVSAGAAPACEAMRSPLTRPLAW